MGGSQPNQAGRSLKQPPPRRRPGPNWKGRCNGELSVVIPVPQLGPGLRRGGAGGRGSRKPSPPATPQHSRIDRRRRPRQRIDIDKRSPPDADRLHAHAPPRPHGRHDRAIARRITSPRIQPVRHQRESPSPTVSVTPADRSRSRLSRTCKDARKPRFGHVATLANPEARPPAITGRAIA